jgi:hypothetical protein
MESANEIHRVGLLLTATELRSANRYWHVMQNDESKRIYPEVYDANVIGILWSTMAQFGTWFGAAPYLPYGIQLLPLTSISEERDDLAWANEMYYPFSKACAGDFECTRDGWVVLELAILATVGYPEVAANRLDELLEDTYESAGGNGHSKTNSLWYIATRPNVQSPIWLDDSDWNSARHRPAPVFTLTDCHTPETCTDQVLDSKVGKFTCRERIDWLMTTNKQSQWEACERVGSVEFPHECGRCDPNRGMKKASSVNVTAQDFHLICPPCSPDECASDLNRCPVYENTFVCSQGASYGGCSGEPWSVDGVQCNKCCEMTQCHKLRDEEANKVLSKIDQVPTNKNTCPPCAPSVCYGTLNQCSVHSAPYLCVNGTSIGGCSVRPWDVSEETSACHECCEVTADC